MSRATALSHELASLSLAYIVHLSKSGERDASIAFLLIFTVVVFSGLPKFAHPLA